MSLFVRPQSPLDVTELTLANGMRVAFKRTAFMRDEVHLTGFAVGGLSEVRAAGGVGVLRWGCGDGFPQGARVSCSE